jgi:hypothetical protein
MWKLNTTRSLLILAIVGICVSYGANLAHAQCGHPLFDPAVTYPAGNGNGSPVPADFNNDGWPDVVVLNLGGVSVLLNNGDGTFAAPIGCTISGQVFHVLLPLPADFDNDGWVDIVHVKADLNWEPFVSIFLNNGDGTFAGEVSYALGCGGTSMVTADLDGDGSMDIAATDRFGNQISVLLNNGDGTFATSVIYGAGEQPMCIEAADLSGDGSADLVTANKNSHDVSVFVNNGDGTFADAVSYACNGVGANGPRHVGLIDLNGDGWTDVVTPNFWADDVSVLLNNGDGTFADAVNYPVGDTPRRVAFADLNSDNWIDMVTADKNSHNVSVLLNDGDGTFAPAVPYGTTPNSRVPHLADLNGDGSIDIAATDNGEDVSILLNNGDGTFAPSVSYCEASEAVFNDLDGDGWIDVAVRHVDGPVLVYLNRCTDCPADVTGDGTVDVLDLLNVLAQWGMSGVPSDINGDGIVNVLDMLEVLGQWGPCP